MNMKETLFAIITGTNNKGGVGKTSSSVNLSITMANLGFKVLFIDGDPQGNGTKSMGVRELINPSKNLWTAFKNKLSYKDVAVNSPYSNVDVIGATQDLEDAVDIFSSSPRRWKLFKQLLVGAQNDYNFIFIDTPPAKGGILTPAALAASDFYLIPSFADSDSYDGFVKIVSLCEDIKENENEKLSCLGVLITCLKKNPASNAYLDYVVTLLNEANMPIFPHYIAQSDTMD
ncbi:MAG: AAA family ATPase, partial [Silvanigrellaceae bacterium]|nr:AAA family ATPase [Silvanigrellaceae bacterium]